MIEEVKLLTKLDGLILQWVLTIFPMEDDSAIVISWITKKNKG